MKIKFLGATRQVTGSSYFLDAGGVKILVDCGLFQERDFSYRNWKGFPLPPDQIQYLLLTHVHLDHSGLIPKLIKVGFEVTFLGSKKYVSTKLQSLNAADLQVLREVFQQNIIPRLMKEFFYHMPYGKQKLYRQELKTAPLGKLTRLINITALLLQTKVYLFWQKIA